MANISDALFWISLAGLFVLTLWGFLRNRKVVRSPLLIAFLSAVGAICYDLFHSASPIRPKGDQPNQWAFIGRRGRARALRVASKLHQNSGGQ
jgi:hypothetical protein